MCFFGIQVYNKNMINLIACVDQNYGIGKDGKCLYNIKMDRILYHALTYGQVVVMGGMTFRSLPKSLLKKSVNLILSSSVEIAPEDEDTCFVYQYVMDIREAIKVFSNPELGPTRDVFIVGGESMFREFLDDADRIYLGRYLGKPLEADTFFPRFNRKDYCHQTIYGDDTYQMHLYTKYLDK